MKKLMTGNEAIARGAYEAGVRFGAAYPGTPSTEIFENLPLYKEIYSQWSPNEKVAYETAYGAAIAGLRSISAMKHVGVNVAADPMFTSAYLGVNAGMVLVTADDPDLHSSQNEQDNRLYAKHAKLCLIEPSDSQECKDFLKEAYEISERFDIPVLYRVTTRICHSKSTVELSDRVEIEDKPYERSPKFSATPARAKAHHMRLENRLKELEEYACTSPLNKMEIKGDVGVITASASYNYAKEVFDENTSFLKLGLTYPMPKKLILEFASKVKKLYVIEELEPFMEEQIKAMGIECIGKELIPNTYELNPEILRNCLFGTKSETKPASVKAASRPPVLCAGCPHRGFFYTLNQRKDVIIASDIGCYTLGGGDTCICMGAGFSAGAGIAKALELKGDKRKVYGVLGDSTFFHSGMTGALEIVYNNSNVIPCVLDNGITAMTGHQDNPGTGYSLSGQFAPKAKIEDILRAFGYENIIIVDPNDLDAVKKACDEAENSDKRPAIITRRPCLLLKRESHTKAKFKVNAEKCKSCKLCLKVSCPAISMADGKSVIDKAQCAGCSLCAQVCPFGAIEMEG